MHSDWFNGIEILQGRWQLGEKLGYCHPRGLEKTLFLSGTYMSAGHERVNLPYLKLLVCECLSKRLVDDGYARWQL